MAEDTFGTATGTVVFAKTQRREDGTRSLRMLVRTAKDDRTIGLVLGGESFEPALASLKAGRLAVGAKVRVKGGTVLRSTQQVLADGRTTTLVEVRYAAEIKTVEAVEPLPPMVRRVTQFA